MMKKLRTLVLVLCFMISAAGPAMAGEPILEQFDEIWDLIQEKFVREIPDTPEEKFACFQKTLAAGISECLDDPHSRYQTSEDAQIFDQEIAGQFGGVGMELTSYKNRVVIVAPIDDTPAAQSGKLEPLDIIVEVDGEDIRSKSLAYVVGKIRGAVGTPVSITVERKRKKLEPVTLKREIIKIETIKVTDIGEEIAYVKIKAFDRKTLKDFAEAVLERLVEKNDGGVRINPKKTKFIFDLRNNPGGLLDVVLSMGYLFSDNPDDILLTAKTRNDEFSFRISDPLSQIQKANVVGIFKGLDFVILINEGSASASEIFAGLMKDWGKAKLIGTKSFGKGSVQDVITLDDGSSLTITTAEFFVGNGKVKINHVGVEPDYWVDKPATEVSPEELILEQNKLDPEKDPVLKKANEVLTEKAEEEKNSSEQKKDESLKQKEEKDENPSNAG